MVTKDGDFRTRIRFDSHTRWPPTLGRGGISQDEKAGSNTLDALPTFLSAPVSCPNHDQLLPIQFLLRSPEKVP
jgi:hypothetical protein